MKTAVKGIGRKERTAKKHEAPSPRASPYSEERAPHSMGTTIKDAISVPSSFAYRKRLNFNICGCLKEREVDVAMKKRGSRQSRLGSKDQGESEPAKSHPQTARPKKGGTRNKAAGTIEQSPRVTIPENSNLYGASRKFIAPGRRRRYYNPPWRMTREGGEEAAGMLGCWVKLFFFRSLRTDLSGIQEVEIEGEVREGGR